MLKVKDLAVKYGMIEAVKGVSFQVKKGEIVSLIGANGAGKTTIMHALSKLIDYEGEVFLEDKNISRLKAFQIVKESLAQVPERRRVFADMSVEENLKLGAYLNTNNQEIQSDMEKVYNYFPRLRERKNQLAGTLSGGEQQMLAMARALMSRPKILLLDEPSMGLAPLLIKEIFNIIQEINKNGTTILLVEQNAKMALAISDYAYVLETGKIILEGSGKQLSDSQEVKKAYLGG